MTSQTKPLPNVFFVRNEAFIANYLCLLIGGYVRLRLIKPLYICRRAAIFVGSFFLLGMPMSSHDIKGV